MTVKSIVPAELCDAFLKQSYWPYGKSSQRCLKKAWKDGKCRLHHPDEKRRRQKKRDDMKDYEHKRRKQFFKNNDIANPANFY